MTPLLEQALTLHPGGLVVRRWVDPETGKARTRRTATIEPSDLYRGGLDLARGVRLIDLFRLVHRNFEVCAELLWPNARRSLDVGVHAERRRASANCWLRLRWPGVVQDRLCPLPQLSRRMEFDMIELLDGEPVGPDIALDLTPSEHLAFERLLIESEQTIVLYGSTDALRSKARVDRRPTLAQVIDAIFFELTWHGSPDDINATVSRLTRSKTSAEADGSMIGLDDLFPTLMARSRMVDVAVARIEALRGRALERPLQVSRCRETLMAAICDASIAPGESEQAEELVRLEAAFAECVGRYVPLRRRRGATLGAGLGAPRGAVAPS